MNSRRVERLMVERTRLLYMLTGFQIIGAWQKAKNEFDPYTLQRRLDATDAELLVLRDRVSRESLDSEYRLSILEDRINRLKTTVSSIDGY